MTLGAPKLRGLLATALLVVFGGACADEEQGGLEGASPGPDAVVGGEIDRIELFYDDIVVDADVSVIDPDGTDVSVETRVDTDISVIAELGASLSEPGVHEVRHGVDAVDGDRVDGSYTFTFDPSAPAPQLVFPPEDSGVPWLLWLVAVVGVVVIAVLGWQLLQSLATSRRASQSRQL